MLSYYLVITLVVPARATINLVVHVIVLNLRVSFLNITLIMTIWGREVGDTWDRPFDLVVSRFLVVTAMTFVAEPHRRRQSVSAQETLMM